MQTPRRVWLKQLGTTKFDYGNTLATDPVGNILIAGYTYGELEPEMSKGGSDAWIAKYDPQGQQIWIQQFGGPFYDLPLSMVVDSQGATYVGGFSRGNFEEDTDAILMDAWITKFSNDGEQLWLNAIQTHPNDAVECLAVDQQGYIFAAGFNLIEDAGFEEELGIPWLIKLDAEGQQIWRKPLPNYGREVPQGIAIDSEGRICIVGNTQSNFDNGEPLEDVGVFLLQLTPEGQTIWLTQFATPFSDFATGLALDSRSNLFITGYTYGDLKDESNTEKPDAWVSKFSPLGQRIWTAQIGINNIEESWTITTDVMGNVLVGGSAARYDAETSIYINNAWAAKYDAEGERLWMLELDSDGSESTLSLATDGVGHIYLCGFTSSDLLGGSHQGSTDIWLAKYQDKLSQTDQLESVVQLLTRKLNALEDQIVELKQATGFQNRYPKLNWIRQIGTAESDYAMAMATDNSGHVIVAGYTYGQLEDGAPQGAGDAWLSKFDVHGRLMWQKQFGTVAIDAAADLVVDRFGNTIVSGYTHGNTDEPQGSKFEEDAWVAKFSAQGDQQWIRVIRSEKPDAIEAITTDGQGNIFIAGYEIDDASDYEEDLGAPWLIKLDGAGNQIWKRPLLNHGREAPHGIATSASGHLYITGNTQSNLKTGEQLEDVGIFLYKLDLEGALIWSRQISYQYTDVALDLALDNMSNIYLTGFTFSDISEKESQQKPDAWLAKFSPSGNQEWIQQISEPNVEEAFTIATNPLGEVIIAGLAATDDPDADLFNTKAWIAKYDGQGRNLWQQWLDSEDYDKAMALAIDSLGRIHVAGHTSGAIVADQYQGNTDIFLGQYQDVLGTNEQLQLLTNYVQGQFQQMEDAQLATAITSSGADTLHAPMLRLAQRLTKGAGDGRLSFEDAKQLLDLASQHNLSGPILANTLGFIQDTYTLTDKAKDWLRVGG